MHRLPSVLVLLLLLTSLCACGRYTPTALTHRLFGPSVLRVGVVADAPPLAYRKNGTLTGLETGFAAGLAAATGRKLELVELPATDLAPALRDKKIDIAMAGLSVAAIEQQHLAATEPYLRSGLIALVRLDRHKQLGTGGMRPLTARGVRVGVVTGTAGDAFVSRMKTKGKTSRYASTEAAVRALVVNAVDVLVHDLPASLHYAALHVDQGLTPGTTLMTSEQLAWAVHPDNEKLRTAADRYLATIRASGELQTLLERFLPFYSSSAYSPRQ